MKTRHGTCAICGEQKPLTFEHIPPRSAYNDRTVKVFRGDKALARLVDDLEGERGQLQQKGAGNQVTCAECNNKSGRWYAREYAAWVERGLGILDRVGYRERQDERTGQRIVDVAFEGVRPLLFLKQVVYMILAVNGAGFSAVHPDLRRLVLNRDATGVSDACHFYLGLTWGPGVRHVGITAGVSMKRGASLLSEVAFPPFACVMCLEQPWHGLPVCDITGFARYGPEEITEVELPLLLGFTHLVLPSDYRSRASIDQTVAENEAIQTRMDSEKPGT